MDARKIKAERIVAGGRITRGDGCWLVPSQTAGGRYRVVIDGLFPSCTCEDFELTGADCKHMLAARMWVEQGKDRVPHDPTPAAELPPLPPRKTYKQDWKNYNLAQTREKSHVQGLLADLCAGLPGPKDQVGTKGGRPAVSVRDAVYAVVYKVYCGFSARRFMCDLEAAREAGHLSRKLCHNSVLKAMDSAALTPVLRELVEQSALPLAGVETKFAVDSSGFCTTSYTRYFDVKYGAERSVADYVKVHLCTGTRTNCVTAADIFERQTNDCPQLPALVDRTAEGFKVAEVTGDKAYSSSENFEAVAKHGGTLYAQFKSNATGGIGGVFGKAFHYFQFNREEILRHYHQRSNVESTFSGIKRKMGNAVLSKTDTAQRNEVYCKLIAWNLTCLVHAIYELGVVPVFWQEPEEVNADRDIIKFPGVG